MGWLETSTFTGGLVLVVLGLTQWFGFLRAERDPVLVARTRRVAVACVGLGVVLLLVHAALVLA